MRLARAVLFALLWQSQYVWSTGANSQTLASINREADDAITAGHFDGAIKLIERGLSIDPAWREGLWKAALILYQHDQFESASHYLRRLTRVDPANGAARALQGMSEFQLHQFRAAIEDIDRAERLGIPTQLGFAGTARQDRAIAYIELGDFGTAVNLLNKLVLAKDADEREQLVTLLGYASLQQSTRAPLTPDQAAMVNDLGEARYASADGDHARAKTLLEALMQKHPSAPMLHYTYGNLLFSWSDYHAAKAEFRAELAMNPASFAARLALAFVALKTNEIGEALPYALEASKMRPDSYLAHLYLGRLLIASGQLLRGCHELETACALSPSNTEVRYMLATTYRRLGKSDEAQRELKKFEDLKKLGNSYN